MPLLLPSAKLAVLVDKKERRWRRIELALFGVGLIIVLAGALDLSRYVQGFSINTETMRQAFAPAATLP